MLVRGWMWPALVPLAVLLHLHESVFVVFLYSTYANWASDLGTYQAFRARRQSNTEEEEE